MTFGMPLDLTGFFCVDCDIVVQEQHLQQWSFCLSRKLRSCERDPECNATGKSDRGSQPFKSHQQPSTIPVFRVPKFANAELAALRPD
jgi:hypothetical protein